MGDTKSRSKQRPPQSGPAEPGELQIRVRCEGKTSQEVLRALQTGLTDAALADRDPLIVLEDLGRLGDSVVTLIKGLSRLLVGYPRTVTFWETSGYTEAFMSVMETRRPNAPPNR
jgi:hypothetical protein